MSDITYWNDLLRGRELALGLDTPLLDRQQVVGREEKLRILWLNAPQEDRDYVKHATENMDAFAAEHGIV